MKDRISFEKYVERAVRKAQSERDSVRSEEEEEPIELSIDDLFERVDLPEHLMEARRKYAVAALEGFIVNPAFLQELVPVDDTTELEYYLARAAWLVADAMLDLEHYRLRAPDWF